jgi:hypothetical protein
MMNNEHDPSETDLAASEPPCKMEKLGKLDATFLMWSIEEKTIVFKGYYDNNSTLLNTQH